MKPYSSVFGRFTPWYLLAAVLLVFLAGCGADVDQTITFYPDEAWEAEIVMGIPQETVALYGSPAALEQEMDDAIAELEAVGADASWESRREGNLLQYTIHAEGKGYATLKEIAFNDADIFVTTTDGQRQVHFSVAISRDFLDANSNTLTLVGDEVISSNGREIEKGVVQWDNPSGRVEAVLTERSRFSLSVLLIPLGVLAAAGVVVGGGWFLFKQRRQPDTCYQCGTWLSSDAQFCPNCGQKR